MKDIEKAKAILQEAISLNPDYAKPYFTLASIYLSEKQVDKAIEQYEALLAKKPDQVSPHMMLGTIYDMQEKFDLSEKHYRAALEIKPDFAAAANNLAYILSTNDQTIDEALKFAQIAKGQLPDDPSVMDTLGWIYYKKELYDSAIQELTDSASKLPQNATVRYHLGMAYYKRGKKSLARRELERALSLQNDFKEADEARGILAEL
jgi:tetratricopeptide (TPR) repeat protein